MSDPPAPPHITPPPHAELEWREVRPGSRPGARYVRIGRHKAFRRLGPGYLMPEPEADQSRTGIAGALRAAKRLLVGAPLASEQEIEERTGKFKGLAIFASDNISSSAYASEEIMRVLALAGVGALSLTMPLTLAIIGILAIVVISYRQVIFGYPNGGGSYVVAFENLGTAAGLVAAASLLTDYILTVAVSVSAGVAAMTSAFPAAFPYRVAISAAVIAAMTIVNLRGLRESGNVFAIPTYVYVVAMLGMLGYGFFRYLSGTLPHFVAPPQWAHQYGPIEALSLVLILRAFADGSVALTGTEAVSNGVPAFKPPEVPNAQTVLVFMGSLFGTIFFGLSFLAGHIGIIPDPTEVETVNSQLSRILMGTNWYFYLVQFSTAVLLVLAANTAFNGFPRLASILARDRFLPHQFEFRGDRLAFSTGIIALALVSILLVVGFGGSVTALIPLYTVGVFVAFTLSQIGLVRHWAALREPRWRLRAAINGVGAAATGVVAVITSASKFLLGAWIVLVLIPFLVGIMWTISRHYRAVARASEPSTPISPEMVQPRIVVPIAGLGVPAKQALAFAQAIAGPDEVSAVYVAQDEDDAERLRQEWDASNLTVPLVIIESPFRSLIGPLLAYIEALRETRPQETVVVVLAEFVPHRWWQQLLHNQTALRLKAALLFRPGVVVVNVPYHLAA
ncbi:MAG: APC family permease [Chloroflexota bacterium]|nr:APC family permease [Chloroflexota bacterium]